MKILGTSREGGSVSFRAPAAPVSRGSRLALGGLHNHNTQTEQKERNTMMPVAARPGQSIRSNECPDDHGFSPDGSQGGRPTGSDTGGIRLSTQAAGGRTRSEANFCRGPVYACVSEMAAG